MQSFFQNALNLTLDAAPWLLLGLVIGGLLKTVMPARWLERHLRGEGIVPVIKAALIGAPLPLCSCGVVPAALGLRRAGASRAATTSFLVSTPETGVDSISVTYAMLGPIMAVTRPLAAISSAITAGLLVGRSAPESTPATPEHTIDIPVAVCCAGEEKNETEACCADAGPDKPASAYSEAIRYAFTDLLQGILFWMVIGLLFSAAIKTWVSPDFLSSWGSGLPAMLVMIVISIPMYVCATASTPIAAGLMLAGISPGTALVFLLAGPATNIGTLGIISRELGRKAMTAYLAGVGIVAICSGLLLDSIVTLLGIDFQAQLSASEHLVPHWIAWLSLAVLGFAALRLGVNRLQSREK